MPIRIAASLAAASLTNLSSVLRDLEAGGADMVHFDVEDGSFVPALNLGTKIIGDLRLLTRLPFDVHLMVTNPEWIIPEIARCGADRVSVHAEACPYPRRVLGLIKQFHLQAGLAFNPGTAIPPLDFCMPYLDFILVLTTEPETMRCDFLPSVLAKVAAGKKQAGLAPLEWSVDGGVTAENVNQVVRAGAEVIVAGRSVFEMGQVQENLRKLKAAIDVVMSEQNNVSNG